ncbi:C45 family peptidase [Mesorhizobium sp. YM1C-6-2]|uniref:C45 family autoproteolytic acyltransferase/hydolase n=1 Tax=Mesorhizobium sp. YM1C-6-2 TaxID=1827501 RepID=UPI000EF1D443|nr:C45 family peptidase [Mesorhizobium sp. YM1C-6-2]RLP23125.1 peptidase C45 [Mesorhizobium sp. YM1C-6-2]
MSTEGRLGFLEIAGKHHDIGVQLGLFGADIVHRHLVIGHAWASVMAFRDDPRAAEMRRLVEARLPAYWSELQGLAQGLALPFNDVFLWNCRGDVWAMAPDGCTTVQIPGDAPVVAHNEDGDPGFRGHCALARVQPVGGRSFTSFVYPASIPGHTFAATETGLVQTVNNIRSRDAGAGLPRMILGRAILDCGSLDEATELLRTSQRAGAFHMTLAQRGDPRLVSVEFTHSSCSVEVVRQPRCHANHLVHQDMSGERQIITSSSSSRQQRGDAIIAGAGGTLDPTSVLWDGTAAALPIYRAQPDDPDHENTLATAVFDVGSQSLDWQVYDQMSHAPCYVLRGTDRRSRLT